MTNNQAVDLNHLQGTIQSWLDSRQRMMVAFNHLCLLKPFPDACQQSLQRTIEEFCTELVDYMSFGQFKIFENMLHFAPPQSERGLRIKKLLSKIFSSTIQGIEFHDTYINKKQCDTFEEDLSNLGEQLAHRLDWEDQLLEITYDMLYESQSSKDNYR